MIKGTQMFKALIIKSGLQHNGTIVSKNAVEKMYNDNNEGMPLLNAIDYNYENAKTCAHLTKTELVYNNDNEAELYGYFVYD